jgi:ABC-type phosphate transport system substrate-binding protein
MLHLNIRHGLLGTCAMAALTLVASNGAQAQTTLNGGGSTLAQPTYTAAFNAYRATIDPTVTFNYAGVGSGAGQRGVLCNDPSNDTDPAGTIIHFGASDATLSAAQITEWNRSVCIWYGGRPRWRDSRHLATP